MIPALGMIETLGLVPLLNALDAALKSANVKPISGVIKLDGGIVAVMIAGDVSSVRAAIEAGAEAASRIGELKAAHVIPRPDDALLPIFLGADKS
ncbi:MAG: BMC domain-containing protein [Planctomycetota bacterium]|nr:MAG: BMC domain-containing protein [Planctomycetota bacterium]